MGKYNFRINGHDYQVDVNSVEGGIADVIEHPIPLQRCQPDFLFHIFLPPYME